MLCSQWQWQWLGLECLAPTSVPSTLPHSVPKHLLNDIWLQMWFMNQELGLLSWNGVTWEVRGAGWLLEKLKGSAWGILAPKYEYFSFLINFYWSIVSFCCTEKWTSYTYTHSCQESFSHYREEAMAPHSSTLAWKIPWMEEPGRLQFMGSRRVGHNWTTSTNFHVSLSCVGEGNGNPLQCSCLENSRDGGAWWASVYGVVQSRTQSLQNIE